MNVMLLQNIFISLTHGKLVAKINVPGFYHSQKLLTSILAHIFIKIHRDSYEIVRTGRS